MTSKERIECIVLLLSVIKDPNERRELIEEAKDILCIRQKNKQPTLQGDSTPIIGVPYTPPLKDQHCPPYNLTWEGTQPNTITQPILTTTATGNYEQTGTTIANTPGFKKEIDGEWVDNGAIMGQEDFGIENTNKNSSL